MNRIDTDTLDTFLFGARKGLSIVHNEVSLNRDDPKLDNNTLDWILAILIETSDSLNKLSFGDIKK